MRDSDVPDPEGGPKRPRAQFLRRTGWILALAAVAGGVVAAYELTGPSLKTYADLERPASLRAGDPPVVGAGAGSLTARFLGTASIALSDGQTTMVTDGFFSRPGPLRVLLTKVSPDETRITDVLAKAGLTHACGVFVAHSHYDHAMDSAIVAERLHARLFGSTSTAQIAKGAGFPEANTTIIPAEGDQTYDCGPFKVTALVSPHSPGARYPGPITGLLKPPAKISEYRMGDSYAFLVRHGPRTILIQASANARPGMYRGVKADVVFLSIGSLGQQDPAFIEAYWREVVRATGAKLVIPIHWDNFTRGLDKPLEPIPRAFDDFDASTASIRKLAEADGVEVRLPRAFETIGLPAPTDLASR